MKKLFLLAVVALGFTTAQAQIASGRSTSFFSTEKSDEGITFGVRAGSNINSFTGDVDDATGQVGFRIGAVADIPIIESLHFEPGLYFSTRPCERTGAVLDGYDSYAWTVKYNPSYLELPLMLSYRYNFSENWGWRVNFGPYIAYGLGGKAKYSDTDGDTWSGKLFGSYKDEYGDKEESRFNRLDVGLQFSTSATYKRFMLEVGYQVGLTNINNEYFYVGYDEDRATVKNSGVFIQLGYNF
ncbi:MAG: PorT family protein [Bacteroidaceae bacterium]|nr:PorT family protein [Bacteroidaceae bacterium]